LFEQELSSPSGMNSTSLKQFQNTGFYMPREATFQSPYKISLDWW